MPPKSIGRREVPIWLALVGGVLVLAVAAWFYRGEFTTPSGPDVFSLDPRNPENVAMFRQLDAYYKANPGKRPSRWPPPQFTEESIARAQEQHRKDFAEAEKRRADVIQQYLKQNKQGGK